MKSLVVVLAVLAAVAIAMARPMMKPTASEAAAFASLNTLSASDVENHVWAVLIAGSSGWDNYRHQADICHAYQTLHTAGVPDEHIVTMLYDDIARNSENPSKGVIINEPDGPNVYTGLVSHPDYSGDAITIASFVNVLTGVPNGQKKVLQSGPQDHVFVMFDDHGNTDIIGFPDEERMTSKQLNAAIATMSQKKLFGSLVVYISACLSGSMFYKATLPANVYVATSAPVGASAYAIFYDEKRSTYLCSGWPYGMSHFMDTNADAKASFTDQFTFATATLQNYSQPCQYGDLTFAGQSSVMDWFNISHKAQADSKKQLASLDAVPEWDVPYELARRRIAKSGVNSFSRFNKEVALRRAIDKLSLAVGMAAVGDADKLLPCTTCDETCNCIKSCEDDAGQTLKECKFWCCNQKGCTSDYKADSLLSSRASKAYECTLTLNRLLQRQCKAVKHAYLAKAEADILHACHQKNVNVRAAAAEIVKQCAALNTLNFF